MTENPSLQAAIAVADRLDGIRQTEFKASLINLGLSALLGNERAAKRLAEIQERTASDLITDPGSRSERRHQSVLEAQALAGHQFPSKS